MQLLANVLDEQKNFNNFEKFKSVLSKITP